MKLHILSDLHLEFDKGHTLFQIPKVEADILILAGDIWVGQAPIDWLKELSERYKFILYLPGNHEYYLGHTYQYLNEEYRELENLIPGFIFLHNTTFEYENVKFIGATLWTDFNKNDPIAKEEVRRIMNDFRLMRYLVDGKPLKVLPTNILHEHIISRKYIIEKLAELFEGKKIIITHHCPSFQSIHPKYHQSGYMNFGFYSDLDYLVEQADMWIHGHTHDPFDYQIGKCKVICNPRGYERRGQVTKYNPELVVEI